MKTTGSPFARIDGQAYVIANFTLEPAFGLPALPELLEKLLERHSGKDILILRRLTEEEAELLEEHTRDYEHGAWAMIVAGDEKEGS